MKAKIMKAKITDIIPYKLSEQWIIKIYFENINDLGEVIMPEDMIEYLPENMVKTTKEFNEFDEVMEYIVDEKINSFLNLKTKLFSPNKTKPGAYYIYKPEDGADEGEFLVKIAALRDMVFDI